MSPVARKMVAEVAVEGRGIEKAADPFAELAGVGVGHARPWKNGARR